MISFQLVFFTTLAVNVCGQHILHSPVSFKYLENDTLILKIVLENVPSDITQYLLHIRTDRHGPKISHITPKNGIHNVKTKLNVKNVVLDLEIKNNGQTCAIFNILNGTQSTGLDGRSEFREQCLNHYDKNYCSIKVDFKKRCEDDSSLECHVKDETLTSFSGNNGHSEVTAWSQHYIARKESSVSLPSTKVKGNSYMKMKMYKFKNNTQLSMKTEFSKKYYNVSVPLDKAGYTIERVPFTRSESDEILRNARGTFENAKLECKITESSKYVCTFNTQLPNIYSYTIHQIYSTTNITIGTFIRFFEYPYTIVFTIEIERFDFNSTIILRLHQYKDDIKELRQFNIGERDIVKDHNYAIMSYSDTERVIFSCEQYIGQGKYSSVGLIDSSGYKIDTVKRTSYNELLDVSKNGSMLCCIYYKVDSDVTADITRVIANKTLLLYKKDEMKGYLGLYVAIPTVLLAAAFVAVVYVCRKKKPLPNPTVPTSQPYYGNQIFPREPNRGIYILPENNDPEYEQVS